MRCIIKLIGGATLKHVAALEPALYILWGRGGEGVTTPAPLQKL